MRLICYLILSFLFAPAAFGGFYNILEFGAVPDGKTLNTKSIQDAIDACNARGGGEVIVPAGTYYTGTIFLKSNVCLNLLSGAVIQGSYDPADYPDHNISSHKKFGTITHNGVYTQTMKSLIIADNAHHISIKGEGMVKGAGEGEAFQLGLNKDGKPKSLFFIGCTHLVLKGIRVYNAGQITVSISGCERVFIDGLYIQSLVNWNNDGLDVDAKDVIIANCIIDSEDDAICFKSEYLDKYCENITVTNCVVTSICNGIKLGTGSRGGFRNITVSNCVINRSKENGFRHWEMTPDIVYKPELPSVNTGIVIMGVDGGFVENINFSDIIMRDVLSTFFVRVGKRFLKPNGETSTMRNITIQNIHAEGRSIIPAVIAGLEESPIENITFSNIHITLPMAVNDKMFESFPAEVFENNKSYPENRITFGMKIPAAAFYVKSVKELTMNGIHIRYPVDEVRPPVRFENTERIKVNDFFVNGEILNF